MVDSLDIKITTSANSAEKAINSLVGGLDKLNKHLKFDTSSLEKLGSINGNDFKKIGDGLQSFSNAAKSIQGVDIRSFDKLAKGIERLASIDASKLEALGRIDGNSFRALGDGVKSLSSGMKNLENVKKADFNRLASGIERLAGMQPGNMQAVAGSLLPLANGINILSNANFENKNIQNLINSLTRLSDANVGSLSGVNFTQLGNSISNFANALSGADKVPQSVIGITNAVAKLAQAGGNIGKVATQLPALEKSLKRFIDSISKASSVSGSVVSFTQAIASLANAGSKAGTTAANLKALGDELKKLFSTMSTAPAVSRSTIQMTQALGKLAGSGGRVGISMDSSTKALRSFGGAASKSSKQVGNLAIQFGKLFIKVKALLRGLKSLWRSMESAMDYVETLNYFNAAFRQVAENADLSAWEEAGYKSAEAYADSFANRAKQLTKKMTGFKVSGTGELTRTSMPSLGLDPDKTMQYQATFAQMASSMGATSEAALQVSNALTMIGADLASVRNLKFEDVWNDMASGLAGMSRTLDKYGVNIRNVNLQQKLYELGIDESITKINQQDKALLRTIILLNTTKYAWGDLASTINQPSNQLRLLTANFQALSRTIGSLFIPMITKVLPYINGLVIALQRLFAWIGKSLGIKLSDFTASMGGMSDAASGLLDMADGADNASDAIEKTDDTAKELEKTLSLMPFDELNQLSGAAKDLDAGLEGDLDARVPNIDYSDILGSALDDAMSEYQKAWDAAFKEMSNKANEIADKIVDTVKSAWKRADFSDIGATMGSKLKTALEKIPWAGIQKAAAKIGKSLATLINGFVEVPGLAYTIGKTIAEAINTALIGLDSFAKNIHWESIGAFLGEGINGVLGNINWKAALSAAKNIGKGIGRAINSFLLKTDFSLVGKTAAKSINTAIEAALSLGSTIDFKLFGRKLADAINAFFKTFKADKVANAINVWVKGALTTASTLLKQTDFDLIGQKIGDFLVKLDLSGILGGLASTIWEAIKGAFSMLTNIFAEAPIEASLIAAFAILKFTGVGKFVAGNVASAIGLSIENAMISSGFASNLQFGVAKAVGGAVAAFAEFSVIKESVKKLTMGTGDLITEIGKIGGAAVVAGVALTAIFGFPAGTIAAALVGVTGAFAGVISANDELARKLKEEEEISRYGQTIDELTADIESSSKAIKDRMKAADEYIKTAGVGEAKMAQDLSEKYFALAEKQDRTNEETEEMKRLADLLVDTMPELSKYYDEQTGLLTTTKDKIDELIQSRLEEIKLNAIEEQLTEAYKQQAEQLLELEAATRAMNDKQAEMNELKQRYDELLEKSTMLQQYLELGKEIQNCTGDTSELIQRQDELKNKLTNGGTEKIPSMESLRTAIMDASQDLYDFQGEYDKVKKGFVEADETANQLQGSIDRWTEMYTSGMKNSAKEGISAHNNILSTDTTMKSADYEAARKSAYEGGGGGAEKGWSESKGRIKSSAKDAFLGFSLEDELKKKYSGYAVFSAKGYNEKIEELRGETERTMRTFFNKGVIDPTADTLDSHSPSKVFEAFGKSIADGLRGGIDANAKGAKDSIETLGGTLKTSMEGTLGGIENSANSTIRNLSNSFNTAETDANNAAGRIRNIFSGIHIPLPHIGFEWDNMNFGDFSIPIPRFKIDWYAKGGLFDKASLIGVGEAGREAVLPLENQRTMKMIASAILEGMGAGMGTQESPFLENIALSTQRTEYWLESILRMAQAWGLEALKGVPNQIIDAISNISNADAEGRGQIIEAFAGSIGAGIEAIKTISVSQKESISQVSNLINSVWEKLANGLNSGFSVINNSILRIPEVVSSAAQGLANAISALPASINSGSTSASRNINISSSRSAGGKSPNDIFKLATGGLITAPIFAHMGEMSRPEAVLPLTDNRAMSMIAEKIYENAPKGDGSINHEILVSAFEEAIVRAMMNNAQNNKFPEYIQSDIRLNEDVMARAISKANYDRDFRMNPA